MVFPSRSRTCLPLNLEWTPAALFTSLGLRRLSPKTSKCPPNSWAAIFEKYYKRETTHQTGGQTTLEQWCCVMTKPYRDSLKNELSVQRNEANTLWYGHVRSPHLRSAPLSLGPQIMPCGMTTNSLNLSGSINKESRTLIFYFIFTLLSTIVACFSKIKASLPVIKYLLH